MNRAEWPSNETEQSPNNDDCDDDEDDTDDDDTDDSQLNEVRFNDNDDDYDADDNIVSLYQRNIPRHVSNHNKNNKVQVIVISVMNNLVAVNCLASANAKNCETSEIHHIAIRNYH